ncbi:MAG: 4a-hydroxytetrahydrobiopterin dehydratase [Anaerolineales bacterium]
MTDLVQMHCSVVSATASRMNDRELGQYLALLPDWEIYKKEGELRLEKVFQFKDFLQAINFTNRVALIANEEDHHPAILTEWGRVTVTWWTHKIGGLHLNDFIMAAKTDQLYGKPA